LSVTWRGASNEELRASQNALLPSRPPSAEATAEEDLSRFRIDVYGAKRPGSVRMSLLSIEPSTGRVRDRIHLRSADLAVRGKTVHAPWLVLVADEEDRRSPRLRGRALRAALGDWIEARIRVGGRRARKWFIRVGRPSHESGPSAIRPVRLDFVVLRETPDGPPLIGQDSQGIEEVIAHQIQVAGEVFAQCAVQVLASGNTQVQVADPPSSGLIAVGERFGLPSEGGVVRLMVDGESLGPWKVGSEYAPAQTARLLGHYIEDAGFRVERVENRKISSFTHPTADLVVTRADGSPAEVTAWPGEPLSTDPMQSLEIGAVDLSDGIDAYDDSTAHTGTLEERTLVRILEDGDPRTIDVFIINRFDTPARQGESFLRSGSVTDSGAVVLDLSALARARQSYTLSHELGHVLLDDLGHPDARGEDNPFLLMHSRSSSAIDGPKRISAAECQKIRNNIEEHYFDQHAADKRPLAKTPPAFVPWRR
jgi:hypothetical protein